MDEFIGIIRMFGGNYLPDGWLKCDGSIYNISQYTALFSILGSVYGGDGKTTFAVPDLRGRIPIGMGQGAGLPNYALGQTGGFETATLAPENLPAHDHPISGNVQLIVNDTPAQTDSPVDAYLAQSVSSAYYTTPTPVLGAKSGNLTSNLSLASAGSSTPFATIPPFLALNYIICAYEGIYPGKPDS